MKLVVHDGVIEVTFPIFDIVAVITVEFCVITLAVYAAEWLVRH